MKNNFSSYHQYESIPQNPPKKKKKRHKSEMKRFRKGLNLDNFADKTLDLFKNKIVLKKDFVFNTGRQQDIYRKNDHRFNSILLDPKIWRNKLAGVFDKIKMDQSNLN